MRHTQVPISRCPTSPFRDQFQSATSFAFASVCRVPGKAKFSKIFTRRYSRAEGRGGLLPYPRGSDRNRTRQRGPRRRCAQFCAHHQARRSSMCSDGPLTKTLKERNLSRLVDCRRTSC